jgi:hypothetical protein
MSRASRQGRPVAITDRRFAVSAATIVALLAIVASIRGILNDFVYDDVPIIRDNIRVHGLAHVGNLFTRPYWPPPFVEQLYRPFSLLVVAGEYAVGDGRPIVFRLVSYVLYAVTAVLVYRLATRLLPQWIALGVASLFAVHPVHVEAVALGVNQSELIVGLLAVLMVTRYVDRRRAGALRWTDWAVLAALYAIAVLTKETGFTIPLLLVAADVTMLRREEAQSVRLDAVLGYSLLGVVAIAGLMVRRAVLGSQAFAVVPAADLAGLALGGRMLFMLHVVPMWLRLLVWPQHLQVDFAPGEIAAPGALGVEGAFGLLLVFAVIGGVALAWRRSPVLAFGLLWMVVTLLPVANIVPTGVLLGERTLFLPTVGFLLAVGSGVEHALASHRVPKQLSTRLLAGACVALTILGMVRSAGRHSVWNSQHLTVAPRGTASMRTPNQKEGRHRTKNHIVHVGVETQA